MADTHAASLGESVVPEVSRFYGGMPTPFGTYIHINAVTVLPGHRLHVVFDNGTEQTVDLAPFLFGPLWGRCRTNSFLPRCRSIQTPELLNGRTGPTKIPLFCTIGQR